MILCRVDEHDLIVVPHGPVQRRRACLDRRTSKRPPRPRSSMRGKRSGQAARVSSLRMGAMQNLLPCIVFAGFCPCAWCHAFSVSRRVSSLRGVPCLFCISPGVILARGAMPSLYLAGCHLCARGPCKIFSVSFHFNRRRTTAREQKHKKQKKRGACGRA